MASCAVIGLNLCDDIRYLSLGGVGIDQKALVHIHLQAHTYPTKLHTFDGPRLISLQSIAVTMLASNYLLDYALDAVDSWAFLQGPHAVRLVFSWGHASEASPLLIWTPDLSIFW